MIELKLVSGDSFWLNPNACVHIKVEYISKDRCVVRPKYAYGGSESFTVKGPDDLVIQKLREFQRGCSLTIEAETCPGPYLGDPPAGNNDLG